VPDLGEGPASPQELLTRLETNGALALIRFYGSLGPSVEQEHLQQLAAEEHGAGEDSGHTARARRRRSLDLRRLMQVS
jgi:hypothetical protein